MKEKICLWCKWRHLFKISTGKCAAICVFDDGGEGDNFLQEVETDNQCKYWEEKEYGQ